MVNYWPDKATFDEGVPFQIASGAAIEANATLVAAGRIEGTLTAEGEAPSSGEICVYKPDGIRVACGHVAGESGYRIRDLAPGSYVVEFTVHGYLPEYSGGFKEFAGAYEFRRLAPGSCKVRFSLHGHFTQYFDDKATEAEAQSVTVTAGHETSGVDATLVAEEAPTNVTPPFVGGVGKIGETLSCSNGVWSGNPPIFTYEYFWFRGEEEIEGAESSTYRLGIADAGESIWCAVVVTNSAGEEYEFSSNEIIVPWLGTLSVTKTGGGSGTVSSAPAGIICGVSCTAVFEEGTAITLTAVADSGSEFTGWSGACSGTGPCAFTLGEGAEVVANFAKMRSPSPLATPAPSTSVPAVRQAKKPLRCKVGFRREKHKGKIRCVKAKPRHQGSPKAKRGRA